MTTSHRFHSCIPVAAAALALISLASCGSAVKPASKGVASLGSSATTAAAAKSPGSTTKSAAPSTPGAAGTPLNETSMDEALVKFARCMREHGVDMPDPTPDTKSVLIGGPDEGVTDPAKLAEAQKACDPIMKDVIASFGQPSAEEQEKAKTKMLEFARCMRANGVDFPDPTFGADGQMSVSFGGPGGPNVDPSAMDAAQQKCGGPNGPIMIAPGSAAPAGTAKR